MERHTRLYLARHGQIIGFERMTANGHTDVDINETGVVQMNSLAERLRLVEINAIYATGLKRTEKGARIIGQYHSVPIKTKPDLKEIFFGDWEGMPLEEIERIYPGELDKRYADIAGYGPPNGENMGDVSKRVLGCLKEILKEEEGKNILIIAHGGVNRLILCDALGLPVKSLFNIQQDYGCLNIIDYYPENRLVRLMNG
ncbi:MAG: alpha-ribazole phosphatase [Desulfatiglans sp.]|jgi:alpha-ribazole phosphatase/probable phosphoglycerate mutase|nr:alpha-ribazole phosphatase [Desulfatiglans sp.]